MKKGFYPFVVAIILLVISTLLPISVHAETSTTCQINDTTLSLQNTEIEMQFSITNGALIGLKNKQTDTQYLGGTDFSTWTMFINTTTDNIWEASLGNIAIKGKDCTLSSATSSIINDGVRLNLTYTNIGNMNITLIIHVTLEDGASVSQWTAEVTNQEPNSTITALVFPQITGVQPKPGEKLVWPYREGQIIDEPGTELRFLKYPMPASMQWMGLYTPTDSIYYAVLDETAAYKEFRFGYDEHLLPSSDHARMMSVALYPYAASGTNYSSPTVEIGVCDIGSWYWMADRYKCFIETAWGNEKNNSSTVNKLGTITNKIVRINGTDLNTYATLPCSIEQDDALGIDNAWIFGWNDNGFDTGYPDFNFISEMGGFDAFANAITKIHQQGDVATAYLNVLCADMQSNWYQEHANSENIIGVTGENYYFPLADNRTGVYICPCSQVYQDQLVDRITVLRDAGVDNIFLDQAMELDSLQCFNPNHGHASPATAYAEGIKELVTKLHESFSYNGDRNNYYFMAEGINDYISTFINVGVPAAYRRSEYATMTPGIAQYTIPTIMLAGPTGIQHTADEFADGFLMGQPLYNDTSFSNPLPGVFKRIRTIYEGEPEIYFYGQYMAQNGLQLDNVRLEASAIVSSTKDAIGIQFSNSTNVPITATITMDYAALGITGEIKKITNVEVPGETVVYNAGTPGCNRVAFTVTVPAYDIKAYKISLQTTAAHVIEAEMANIIGDGVVLPDSAASCGQKVGCLEIAGRGIAFPDCPFDANGITMRYSRGWQGSCSYQLFINDIYLQNITFLPTGGWSQYLFCSIPVEIPQNATIKLINESGGNTAIDIDYISAWN